MMREFQIWPQNSNRTTFDPLLGQKTVEKRLSRVFGSFSTVSWPKRGSNVVRFEF